MLFLYIYIFSPVAFTLCQLHIPFLWLDSGSWLLLLLILYTFYCIAGCPLEMISYAVTRSISILWTLNNTIPAALSALPTHHNFQPTTLSWGTRLSRLHNTTAAWCLFSEQLRIQAEIKDPYTPPDKNSSLGNQNWALPGESCTPGENKSERKQHYSCQ